MKYYLSLVFVLGVAFLSLSANRGLAFQVSLSGSYSCETQSDCKSKCEARGGRWQKKIDAPIRGNCYLPSNIAVSDQIEILINQLDILKLQEQLIDIKRVAEWPNMSIAGDRKSLVELKPSECSGLGGEIHVDEDCASEVMCSTEVFNAQTSEHEPFSHCVTYFGGGN